MSGPLAAYDRSMVPLACAGHWYLSLLYVAPVAAVVGGIKVASVRDERHARRAPVVIDHEDAGVTA